jgi:hypothetical protein
VSVIYGGAGNDRIYENGHGKTYVYGQGDNDQIITVGGGGDVVYGGSGLDTLWVDSSDRLSDADAAEKSARSVHVIKAFLQSKSRPAQPVSLDIAGQNIIDPVSDFGYTNNFAQQPLFNGGPHYDDIAQGAVGDCYFMTGISALADTNPGLITQAITELGDGTYAVRFYRKGRETYVRVDAQLPTVGDHPAYARLGRNGGALWVALVEKAFAQFRTGQNSYASVADGWMDEAYAALTGASARSIGVTEMSADELAQTMAAGLAAHHAVAVSTAEAINPVLGNHTYGIHEVHQDAGSGEWYVTVYNPWGIDGQPWDDNANDGLLTFTAAEFQQRFEIVQVCNA